MTRSQSREIAFMLLFEKTFTEEPMSALIEQAEDIGEMTPDPFARRLAQGTAGRLGEIDEIISSSSSNWKLPRISRVALSALRLSIYEILHEGIPTGVSINEAVELTKKFASEDDAAFVNGVLGAVARAGEPAADPAGDAAPQPEDSAAEAPQA